MFERLGKYHIERLLGQGAMGEVYLGVDPAIGRPVAIKTISATSSTQEAEAKERFAREAKAAGVLNHPNVVTIYDFGEDQGVLYIAMEYIKGEDLEVLIRERRLSRSEFLEVLAQVCDGLAFAHQHQIVHRDIKPSNVRVIQDGKRLHAKVMDFGVARVAASDMTATGIVMGTVSYMAPEYIRTGKPDPRSDLFAVGVMLYEVLSGKKPFSGDTTPTILYKIVNEAPDPIDLSSLSGISPAIRQVLDQALAKDPELRYQSADALGKALRACKDPTWSGEIEDRTSLVKPRTLPIPSQQPTEIAPLLSQPTAPAPLSSAPPSPTQPAYPMPPQAVPGPAYAPRQVPKSGGHGLLFGALAGVAALGILAVGGGLLWYFKPWVPKPALQQETQTEMTPGSQGQELPNPDPSVAPPNGEASKPVESKTSLDPNPEASKQGQTQGIRPQPPRNGEITVKPVQPNQPTGVTPSTQPPPHTERDSDPLSAKGDPEFNSEALRSKTPAERKALSSNRLSEGTALHEKDPEEALRNFRQALAANPENANAYAWAFVTLFKQKRYYECELVLKRAQRHGVSIQEMIRLNQEFKRAWEQERFSRFLPGSPKAED